LPPVGIADVATRHKVVRAVIGRVPVEVVNYEAALAWASAGSPCDVASAPVAVMRARPDLVVEDKAGYTNSSGRRS
jgi:hypothetical protein